MGAAELVELVVVEVDMVEADVVVGAAELVELVVVEVDMVEVDVVDCTSFTIAIIQTCEMHLGFQ